MVAVGDSEAIRKTIKLMDYLAEVTAAVQRDPVRDIFADEVGVPDLIVWLDGLPQGVRPTVNPSDDILLRMSPPRPTPKPVRPARLDGWLDPATEGKDDRAPQLVETGPILEGSESRTPPPTAVVREFERWSARLSEWSRVQELFEQRRALYEQLERAAHILEQQDDEFEFVLAAGLLRWQAPDGERICRHLVVEAVQPRLDRVTAEVTVALATGRRRLEDGEILRDQESFNPDRGRPARAAISETMSLLDPAMLVPLQEYLGMSLGIAVATADVVVSPGQQLPDVPQLSASPALMIRPRSRVLLAEAYQHIGATLRQPDAQVPVALAELVVDTERPQREAWLTQQGALAGDVLGEDPLFPLPTNDEQRQVMEVLRSETGVVVQGPPGTGKTHTIANLVSALLARGQRVLVTSQKDQALRVLRDYIPPDLRKLCVLLAGGSKDVSRELAGGLDALSDAVASPGRSEIGARIEFWREQRRTLRSRSAALNDQIRQLREAEARTHGPLVPGFDPTQYRGTLADIARQLRGNEEAHGWFPPLDADVPDLPPLSPSDAAELLRLLRTDTVGRRVRAHQRIPTPTDLPTVDSVAECFAAESRAYTTTADRTNQTVIDLAGAKRDALQGAAAMSAEVHALLTRLGLNIGENGQEWVRRAVDDYIAGRHVGRWGHVTAIDGRARELQDAVQSRSLTDVVELTAPISQIGVGRASGMLATGRELHAYLAKGGRVRTGRYRAAPPEQRRAAELIDLVRVNGQPPATAEQVAAAVRHLETEVAAAQLVSRWSDVDVAVPSGGLTTVLSELQNLDRTMRDVRRLAELCAYAVKLLHWGGRAVSISSLADFRYVLANVPAALDYAALSAAREQCQRLREQVQRWSARADACPEVALLENAIDNRDPDGYRRGLASIDAARTEQQVQLRQADLTRQLNEAHPQLAAMLRDTATEPAWDERLAHLPAAWAWSKASQLASQQRSTDEEHRLAREYDEVETQLSRITAQLAGEEAMRACLDRMSDAHMRALRSYREQMGHVGAGAGRRTQAFRRAARSAMDKAKGAVPAWVVPLPNLLENLAVERNSFDVVIVDEASQVGVEYLLLLWMARRVIVVGDDKQCTPGQSRFGRNQDEVFASLHEHLDELDDEIRLNFTPKSHLYGLLSARSGRDAVVRLREHFRCLPEIINWSSVQFYGGDGAGLVALRERTADDLEPLHVVQVADAYTDGRHTKIRNEIEAKRIVTQLAECINDARYADKTFGIVVLQGTGQIKWLEHEINAAISPEERGARKIRVGSPANFQGDERDVIFLSTVVTQAPAVRRDTLFRQACNVAASRAKDQMWLFTSVPPGEFKPGDLRASLLEYMLDPPSTYGQSPALEAVSATERVEPFDSVFEQRVFREIKARGYHVVPQYPVGRRRLDLVIVGDGGRLAVECDGHRHHTNLADTDADGRRDRELRRMRWEVVRIRESEFEFDSERELTPLWRRLAERGIHPATAMGEEAKASRWRPIDLPEEETVNDDMIEGDVA